MGTSRGRVLVTEAAERGPLAACRSLHDAGYTAVAVAETRLAAGTWSRSSGERFVAPDPKNEPRAFVDALAELAGRRQYEALLPGGDASLIAISEHRARLEKLVRIGLPAHEVVERSVDKLRLLSDAATAGIPPPPTIVCTTPEEATRASRELGYPLALKPPRSILHNAGGGRRQGTVVATTDREVERAVQKVSAPFVVQRFERGAERLSCAGVYAEGELIGLAVARYTRTWPPLAGAASFAETVPPRKDLVAAVEVLLRTVGWEGIFELEVLAFPDGRLAAMDLNPRLFGWLALAIRAGADLPAIWCDFLLGRKRAPVVARPGLRYRWEEAEACSLVWLLRQGHVRKAAALVLPRRDVVHAYFRWRDPAPLLARSAEMLARRLPHNRRRTVSSVDSAAPLPEQVVAQADPPLDQPVERRRPDEPS